VVLEGAFVWFWGGFGGLFEVLEGVLEEVLDWA
jgi:hypothetical protein